MKQVEQYLKKYSVLDLDLRNVAINFSIIKHNEFKCRLKQEDLVATESLDFEVVSNLNRT